MTRYFKQCGILTSVDSDEPVQPPFKLRNSKWCSVSSLTGICAGWSEPLLVAHTTLLEISCYGSFGMQQVEESYFLRAKNEDSAQVARMYRLVCDFVVCIQKNQASRL